MEPGLPHTGLSVPAELLQALRENSGIRLDREGRFWHRGALIEHPGIAQAFHRWLGRDEGGRYVLRTDRDWCVVEVEDAPLLVRSAEVDAPRITLHLSDETTEPLDPATLAQSSDHVLYCLTARGFEARFSRPAYYALSDNLVEVDGRGYLELGGIRHPIASRSRPR